MRTLYAGKYAIVADLYDTYVDYKDDIQFWVEEALKDKEVLELTAGTGRVTIPLARAGAKVTAVDVSSDMLELLRKKARKARVRIDIRRADIRTFDLHRRFPLVIIPFNSMAEIVDGRDREAVLARVRRHLKRDGRAIITAHNFDFDRANLTTKSAPKERVDPDTGLKVVFWSERRIDAKTRTGVSLQHYKEIDGSGKVIRTRLFKNRYHVFDRGDLDRLVQTAGFRVVNAYGDYSYSPLAAESPFIIYELVRSSA